MEKEKNRMGSGERGDRADRATDHETAGYRAALEALFAPKTTAPKKDELHVTLPTATTASATTASATPTASTSTRAAKMISLPTRSTDPARLLREKLLAKLLAAEGRLAVAKAANDFVGAGFSFPEEQDVCVKLLDHPDEERVRDAMSALVRIFAVANLRRRAVLEARLRRLEDDAEEPATRAQATELRRKIPRMSSDS